MAQSRIETLLAYCDRHNLDVQYASAYAEPGYTNPESGLVLLANWNDRGHWDKEQNRHVTDDDTMPRLAKLFERLGCAIEWHDEWITCECGKCFRTSPDSYSWTMSGYIGDGYCLCRDCLAKDPSGLLDDCQGNPRKAITSDQGIHPEDHGYVLLEGDFQNGLYGGQCADPKTIARSLDDLGISEYIFYIDGVGQFDCDFSVYVKREAVSTFVHRHKQSLSVVWRSARKTGKDPATMMRLALEDASRKMHPLSEGGIQIATCHDDGTATVRTVTPEEFIRGVR